MKFLFVVEVDASAFHPPEKQTRDEAREFLARQIRAPARMCETHFHGFLASSHSAFMMLSDGRLLDGDGNDTGLVAVQASMQKRGG